MNTINTEKNTINIEMNRMNTEMNRINIEQNQVSYDENYSIIQEEKEDLQINSSNYKSIIARLTLFLIYVSFCFTQPILLYDIAQKQYHFLGSNVFYYFLIFGMVFNYQCFGMIYKIFVNKKNHLYIDEHPLCFLFQKFYILILGFYVNHTFIILFSIYNLQLEFFVYYICGFESKDKSLEVLLIEYHSSLIQYMFQSLSHLCLIYYCIQEMIRYQIFIFIFLKISFMILYGLNYKYFYFEQTFLNFIYNQHIFTNKVQMVHSLVNLPYEYVLLQLKYLICLKTIEITFILLNILLNFIELNLLTIFLIIPIIDLIFTIKMSFDQRQIKVFDKQNIDIFTKQEYLNLIEDFESNPMKYEKLRSIYIEGLDIKQSFECLFQDFRKISITIGTIKFQNILGKGYLKLKRYNQNRNSQVISVFSHLFYNFEGIVIIPDKILPEIYEIRLEMSHLLNKGFPYYQMINPRTLIHITCGGRILPVEQPRQIYYDFYDCCIVKIIQYISFQKYICNYLPINPSQIFFDLIEDELFMN